MAAITLEWRDGDTPDDVVSLVDGSDVGRGAAGFAAVVACVRDHPAASVAVRLGAPPLGGGDLVDATPFARRWPELVAALGERRLTWLTS